MVVSHSGSSNSSRSRNRREGGYENKVVIVFRKEIERGEKAKSGTVAITREGTRKMDSATIVWEVIARARADSVTTLGKTDKVKVG